MPHPEPYPAVDIRVLGAFDVRVHGTPVRLTGRRARGLLALLAARAGRPVSTADMLCQVWGEACTDPPGDAARNTVQARVSALRRMLGSPLLRATETGYVLDVAPVAVDAARFEEAVRHARDRRAEMAIDDAAAAYAEALDLWCDERAYADVQHVPALVDEADRLAELQLQVLQESLALEVEQGRYDEAAAALVDATRRHPGVEELWALRMLALYGQGRQADAAAVYRQARRQLRDRFGLDPGPRLRELEAMILQQKHPRDGGLRFLAPVRIARPVTSFIGRQRDLDRVAELLTSARLLTLTGPGGVGKTRLAMEAAQALVDSCAPVAAHGVTVVDLIEYRRGDDLATGVLEALGPVVPSSSSVTAGRRARRSRDVLCDVLSDRRLLLILDNCEHLIDDVADLAAVLVARTAATKVLATSREALNIPGEWVYVVDPLWEAPSVELFLDRIHTAQPDLDVDAASREVVANICRRLDGLPLAMELAAVRARVLGLEEVARLLDDRFALLSHATRTVAERHRTLEAVIDWSYDLLEEQDRRMLETLSVFRGSFSVRQAQAVWAHVGGTEQEGIDSIERLVSRSMVQAETGAGNTGRFRLLETMRTYAADRLRDSGAEHRVTVAHAWVYVDLALEHMTTMKTHRQASAVAAMVQDDANIRAAHGNALELGLGAVAQGLVGALGYVAWMREGRAPGWDMVVRSLELPAKDSETRIRALAWATHLGSVFGHAEEAVEYGERAAALAAAHPDCRLPEIGFALLARAHALHRLGRWDEGDAVLHEAREVTAAAGGDQWTLAGCAMVTGLGALARGRLDEAERHFVDAADRYRRCRDRWGQQRAALRRSIVRVAQGDYVGAAQLLREALDFIHGLELAEAAIPAKAALAWATLLAGDVDDARHMVDALEQGGVIGRLSEVGGRVGQCRAVLAEYDGQPAEAVELHVGAARRLLDAGLPAEAIESLARVILLTGRDSEQARAAAWESEEAAEDSADPRVQAAVLDVRALLRGGPGGGPESAADVAAEGARTIRREHGLAVPALLRISPPTSPGALSAP